MGKNETGIRVIPPFVFLAAYLAGWGLHWLWRASFGMNATVRWTLAAVLILAPLAMVPWLFALFRRANSKYDVRDVPKGLVTEGPFRISRNPGYVAMIVMSIGVAILLDNPWILLAIAPAVLVIRFEVIAKEEAILEREFGGDYRRYKARVRRWL
jgi:protein-S-isoprenylcysteine O-methyltransferase Ste14